MEEIGREKSAFTGVEKQHSFRIFNGEMPWQLENHLYYYMTTMHMHATH